MEKCHICGKRGKRQVIVHDMVVCKKTCFNVLMLDQYLSRIEKRREKEEASNTATFNQARELSAWLSVYKHGSAEGRMRAARVIDSLR